MGNGIAVKQKDVTPLELLLELEKNIIAAVNRGEYRAEVITAANNAYEPVAIVTQRLKADGFRARAGAYLFGELYIRVSWEKSTNGKGKICRDKSDAHWASRADELKWAELK